MSQTGGALRAPPILIQARLLVAGASQHTGGVDADVMKITGSVRRFGSEQLVEGGDAVGLRRRDLEHLSDIVDAAWAHPPPSSLQGVQGRQEEVTAGSLAGHAPTDHSIGVVNERGFTDHIVHGGLFDVICPIGPDEQIGHCCTTLSMRMAAALNSAVPLRGSHASLVSRLVSTSSGK